MGPNLEDSSKSMDWKSVEESVSTASSSDGAPVKKRLPKKIRHIPDYYFLPRMSLPSAILFSGSCIAAGIGAGMLTEMWLKKKAKEDARVVSEADK
ncbi:Dihydrosphingosine phosphate lyase [Orobanche gracilis]